MQILLQMNFEGSVLAWELQQGNDFGSHGFPGFPNFPTFTPEGKRTKNVMS